MFYLYVVNVFIGIVQKNVLLNLFFLFGRHRLTRHQYYLQLRKDILEDRLYCNEETGLFLVALALQAEFGDYMPEVPRTKRKMFTLCL